MVAEIPQIEAELARFESTAVKLTPCPNCQRTAAMLEAVKSILGAINSAASVVHDPAAATVRGKIIQAGAAGINASALCRATRSVGTKDRQAIIARLLSAGQITRRKVGGRGRPAVVYTASANAK
jgi:hypothetical protein